MDENPCIGETSERVEETVDDEGSEGKRIDDLNFAQNGNVLEEVVNYQTEMPKNEASVPSISDSEASDTSSNFSPPKYEENENGTLLITPEQNANTEVICAEENPAGASYDDGIESAPLVQTAQEAENSSPERTAMGPPPSYSFVMKQKRKTVKRNTSDSSISDRPPPPTYTGVRGIFMSPENNQIERICNIQPIWRSHSQPALCPRCGILVITTTHSHDSVATHVAALALCLFGCWPCCLLPYCMNVCKNTYHHCPICQGFLGAYTPW